MSRRIALTLALVGVTACGSKQTGNPDMNANPGNDMTMVMTTTIAQAIMGKVTTPITVDAIVTGIVGTGSTTWYVQDPAGGPYSGVAVFCSHTAKMNPCPMTISAPSLHDLVQVTGTLTQFRGKWELAPTAQTTLKGGQTPAAAMTITDAQAAFNGTDASVRAIPVTLMGSSFDVTSVTPGDLYDTNCRGDASVSAMNLCSGCMPPTYSGFAVSDGTSTIYVEQSFFQTDKLASSPECVGMALQANQVMDGRKFTKLGGILDVDPFGPKGQTTVALQPLGPSDYQ